MSLKPEVSDRTAEVTCGGLGEIAAVPEGARVGQPPAAFEQRAAEADRMLHEMREAFEAERAALEARFRAAESYAAEISERLIDVHDAMRVRGARADAERAARAQEIARNKSDLSAARSLSDKLKAELAEQTKRADDARKTADERAAKLKAVEVALQKAEAQGASLERRVQEATATTATLRADLERARKEAAAARQRAEEIRNTIGFKLGHTLIHAGGTWRGAIALPGALASLFHEARRRKRARREREGTGKQVVRARPLDPGELPAHSYRALSILDEISEACWSPDLKLFRLVRGGWKTQIDGSNSQFAFLESCWKGNGGQWEYAFTSPGLKHANAQALIETIAHLRHRRIKIAFWNKEDPMHYDRFLPIARQADVIFTTDARKVADYRRDVPSARIEVLPFAAQPRLCNPAERSRIDQGTLCFAGSYYAADHDDRKRQMDELLPAITEFRGTIYDRMSGVDSDRYRYPAQYRPFIRPAVPFADMAKLYKSFKVFLNVNTIPDSPTMMSRRLYELLACGTPVVSAPSKAVEQTFPGIVQTASSGSQAIQAVAKLLEDDRLRSRIAHLGYREVMRKHTYRKRLDMLLPAMNLPQSSVAPLVSVIICTMRPHMIERIAENLTRQNYERIEIIVTTQGFSHQQKETLANALRSSRANIERVEIVTDDSARTLGERFNHAVSISRGAYAAKMDDDDLYFENYLSDMLIPFSFGDYGLVGKKEIFMYLEGSRRLIRRYGDMQHRETQFVTGATFVARREVVQRIPFKATSRGEDTAFVDAVRAAGYGIYSADPYNFIVWRHARAEEHTWNAGDDHFLNSQHTVIEADSLDIDRVRI